MCVVNKKKIKKAICDFLGVVIEVAAAIVFCIFIYQHGGLNLEMPKMENVREFVTYEYVVQTSPENHRVKEKVPARVVYRYAGN